MQCRVNSSWFQQGMMIDARPRIVVGLMVGETSRKAAKLAKKKREWMPARSKARKKSRLHAERHRFPAPPELVVSGEKITRKSCACSWRPADETDKTALLSVLSVLSVPLLRILITSHVMNVSVATGGRPQP